MISNITNYRNANINKYYGINSINKNINISNIINIAQSSHKNNAYALYDSNNANFIKSYTSTLSNLKELNSNLTKNGKNSILNSISASSSNEKILTAKSFFTLEEKASYNVNVSQIAKAQVNTSDKLESNQMSSMGISTINISKKTKNYSFSIDTNGKTNKQSLESIAAKINKSNIGIYASVKEKDNVSVLELIGDKTGENEDFLITGSEEFMSKTNLSNITQTAQDAVFDITKDKEALAVNKKSSTNEIDIDGYKVSATLKDVGEVTVNLGIDKKKVSETINNFVSAYNSTVSFLSSNTYRGSGVSKQLDKFKIPDIYEKNLKTLGINQDKNGKLSVDDKALDDALSNNTDVVERELGSNYSVFSKIDKNINSALKESSINLINKTPYNNQGYNNTNQSINDSFLNNINLMSIYNNSGHFGMINYSAIGMFLNAFI